MQIVPRQAIDTQKYTALMHACHAPVYAQLWYLDAVCQHFKILVFEDYQAVFILPEKTKYGVRYIMQPDFCQQLGLFGTNVNDNILQECINYIKKNYFYAVLQIHNQPDTNQATIQIHQRSNYVWNLQQKAIYTKNHQRNLQKADKNKVFIQNNITATDCISFFEQHKGPEINKPAAYYRTLHQLLQDAHQQHQLLTFAAYYHQQLVAIAACICHQHTATFILSAASAQGKHTGAAFAIIHHIAQQPNLSYIDFEGSEQPSFARFYSGFGATCMPYYKLTLKKYNIFRHI
jgi:hypothetical protein